MNKTGFSGKKCLIQLLGNTKASTQGRRKLGSTQSSVLSFPAKLSSKNRDVPFSTYREAWENWGEEAANIPKRLLRDQKQILILILTDRKLFRLTCSN